MKLKIIFSILVVFLYSCKNKDTIEAQLVPVNKDSTITGNLNLADSKSVVEIGFMGFFETFMYDKEFQKNNIKYPIQLDTVIINSKKDWVQIPFYMNSSYMPVLNFDTISYFENDVNFENITMNILSFEQQKITEYNFIKHNSRWQLTKVQLKPFQDVQDYKFIEFLVKFSSDSLFQHNHIEFPIPNYYANSEKDYETEYDTIIISNWKHMNVTKDIENLLILNLDKTESDYRYIVFRGVENGIFVKYTFRRTVDDWKLIKLEDYST